MVERRAGHPTRGRWIFLHFLDNLIEKVANEAKYAVQNEEMYQ